ERALESMLGSSAPSLALPVEIGATASGQQPIRFHWVLRGTFFTKHSAVAELLTSSRYSRADVSFGSVSTIWHCSKVGVEPAFLLQLRVRLGGMQKRAGGV